MRISLVAGLNNKSPVDGAVRDLTQARDGGFARLWMTQMPYDADLLTVLAAALREVPDIEVASGVVPIQNQHPMQLAQRALTLNIIGNGRFTLGIGVTHRTVTEGMWVFPGTGRCAGSTSTSTVCFRCSRARRSTRRASW